MSDSNPAVASQEPPSLDEEFLFCERVIADFESGTTSTKEIQSRMKECRDKLENLTREVSARSLFSKNETVDELPTSSLQYLLLPYYLATVTQTIIVEPDRRVEALDKAKIYLRDYLERLLSYEVIGFALPWLKDEEDEEEVSTKMKSRPDPAQIRSLKLKRLEHQKQMDAKLKSLQEQRFLDKDDDSVLTCIKRELLMTRLHLFAMKAMSELDQIDEERPLAEHMAKIMTGQASPHTIRDAGPSRPPFIITRDAVQKKVFGLGYPSIPTVTVDEWYEEMVHHGRFGDMSKGPSKEPKGTESDDEDAVDDDQRRARAQAWDEYKDMHRRGWGNTHNKG